MKDQLISLETAELADVAKFPLEYANYNYSEENEYKLGFNIYTIGDLNNFEIHPAPTQSLLQKWLREEHNLHISVNLMVFVKDYQKWDVYICPIKTNASVIWECESNKSYEEALELGLQEALKLIINVS